MSVFYELHPTSTADDANVYAVVNAFHNYDLDEIAKNAGVPISGHIIDLGCAHGHLFVSLKNKSPQPDDISSMCGVDINPRMLDHARRMLDANGLASVKLVQADFAWRRVMTSLLPKPPRIIAHVFAIDILPLYSPDLQKSLLRKWSSLIQPGSRLHVNFFHPQGHVSHIARVRVTKPLPADPAAAARLPLSDYSLDTIEIGRGWDEVYEYAQHIVKESRCGLEIERYQAMGAGHPKHYTPRSSIETRPKYVQKARRMWNDKSTDFFAQNGRLFRAEHRFGEMTHDFEEQAIHTSMLQIIDRPPTRHTTIHLKYYPLHVVLKMPEHES